MRGYEGEELVSRKSAKHALGRVEGSTKEQIAPKKLPVLGVLAWRMMTGESVCNRCLTCGTCEDYECKQPAQLTQVCLLMGDTILYFRFPARDFRKILNILTHSMVQPVCPSGRIVKSVMLGL